MEECTDAAPGGLGGARVGFAQEGLEFGEDLLDGIEIGQVARQEEQLGAGGPDQLTHGVTLWLPKLSMITMSPAASVGTGNCSTYARKLVPLIGPMTQGASIRSQRNAVSKVSARRLAAILRATAERGCPSGEDSFWREWSSDSFRNCYWLVSPLRPKKRTRTANYPITDRDRDTFPGYSLFATAWPSHSRFGLVDQSRSIRANHSSTPVEPGRVSRVKCSRRR